MDTRYKGEFAQLKIQQRVAEKGFFCSRPTMEGCRYDLIIDDHTRLWKVQCKYVDGTATNASGCVKLGLMRRNAGGNGQKKRKYTTDEIDVVIAYLPSIDKVLWLPPNVWLGKGSIHLRVESAKNGQTKNLLLARDFVW